MLMDSSAGFWRIGGSKEKKNDMEKETRKSKQRGLRKSGKVRCRKPPLSATHAGLACP